MGIIFWIVKKPFVLTRYRLESCHAMGYVKRAHRTLKQNFPCFAFCCLLAPPLFQPRSPFFFVFVREFICTADSLPQPIISSSRHEGLTASFSNVFVPFFCTGAFVRMGLLTANLDQSNAQRVVQHKVLHQLEKRRTHAPSCEVTNHQLGDPKFGVVKNKHRRRSGS